MAMIFPTWINGGETNSHPLIPFLVNVKGGPKINISFPKPHATWHFLMTSHPPCCKPNTTTSSPPKSPYLSSAPSNGHHLTSCILPTANYIVSLVIPPFSHILFPLLSTIICYSLQIY